MEYRRNTSAVWPQKTISEVMSEQANYINGKFEFKCTRCKHNVKSKSGGDTVGCRKNMFISVTGCNTVNCQAFEEIEK